jgi:hypothetical protein
MGRAFFYLPLLLPEAEIGELCQVEGYRFHSGTLVYFFVFFSDLTLAGSSIYSSYGLGIDGGFSVTTAFFTFPFVRRYHQGTKLRRPRREKEKIS